MATIPYLYQLQNASYSSLSSTDFKIGVVDDDSAGLSSSQIDSLQSSGKTIISYLSIGEAEDYRNYWQSSWNSSPPSWMLGENPDWPGNYQVKFWDSAWQKIIIDRAVSLAKEGYNGLVLDVVDVYTDSHVISAYGSAEGARDAMMSFVGKISSATKAIDPHFKIIQNNAIDLVTTGIDDPGSALNSSYLSKIDGITAETTFYTESNSKTSWGAWNLQYLDKAVDAGKEVFTIDYPTSSTAQQDYIKQAIAHDFIPFVGNPSLSSIPSVNYQIANSLPSDALSAFLDGSSGGSTGDTGGTTDTAHLITGTNSSETLNGTSGDDMIYGQGGTNTLNGNAGNDTLHGGANKDILLGGAGNDDLYGGGSTNNRFGFTAKTGHDVIHDFRNPGSTSGDMIDISHAIFSSRAQVLGHIEYSGGNAVIHLDGDNTVTVLGVASHALTAADFHIT